jgi:hypothetical protein
VVLGRVEAAARRPAAAAKHWRLALEMFTAMGSAEAEQVKALLSHSAGTR